MRDAGRVRRLSVDVGVLHQAVVAAQDAPVAPVTCTRVATKLTAPIPVTMRGPRRPSESLMVNEAAASSLLTVPRITWLG